MGKFQFRSTLFLALVLSFSISGVVCAAQNVTHNEEIAAFLTNGVVEEFKESEGDRKMYWGMFATSFVLSAGSLVTLGLPFGIFPAWMGLVTLSMSGEKIEQEDKKEKKMISQLLALSTGRQLQQALGQEKAEAVARGVLRGKSLTSVAKGNCSDSQCENQVVRILGKSVVGNASQSSVNMARLTKKIADSVGQSFDKRKTSENPGPASSVAVPR